MELVDFVVNYCDFNFQRNVTFASSNVIYLLVCMHCRENELSCNKLHNCSNFLFSFGNFLSNILCIFYFSNANISTNTDLLINTLRYDWDCWLHICYFVEPSL